MTASTNKYRRIDTVARKAKLQKCYTHPCSFRMLILETKPNAVGMSNQPIERPVWRGGEVLVKLPADSQQQHASYVSEAS